MINYLKNCQKTTLIGQLPDIINSNNQAIKDEFNWIFDSSLNRLTKSVYAPTGSVKTHFGEFTNLSCEYITIKKPDSIINTLSGEIDSIIRDSFNDLKDFIQEIIDSSDGSIHWDPSKEWVLNHNLLENRFNSSVYDDYATTSWAHDAGIIIYKNDGADAITVENALNALNNETYDINAEIAVINASIDNINSSIDNINSSVVNINEHIDSSYVEIVENENELQNNIQALNSSIIELNSYINNIMDTVGIHRVTLNPNNGQDSSIVFVANEQPFGAKLYTPSSWINDENTIQYTFKGWYDNANNRYKSDDVVNLSNNITLTAKWNEQSISE